MMKIILLEAFKSFEANKLRSFLTALGIIIGVSSVVLMLFIGQGAEKEIKRSIESMGSNILVVTSGSVNTGGLRSGFGGNTTLTVDDANAMAAELTTVLKVAPASNSNSQVVYGNSNWNTSIYGTMPDYLFIRDWSLSLGNVFSERDIISASNVVIIGSVIRDNLFPDEDPIGKTIRIKNIPFEVIGLLSSKGQSLDGRDQDDVIIMPLTTFQRKLFGTQFPGSVRMIMVKATSQQTMEAAQEDITKLLRQRHRLKPNDDNDFNIRNISAIAESQAATARIMSLLLGSIASISLVVGGIGIMNIMLVSVTERTREIGIRKAIGAHEKVIMYQFLAESVILSGAGSIIGVLLGLVGAAALTTFSDISVAVSLWPIILSFGVAASVGVFFGFYPASKAAKLNPIEALRYQ